MVLPLTSKQGNKSGAHYVKKGWLALSTDVQSSIITRFAKMIMLEGIPTDACRKFARVDLVDSQDR